MKPVHVLAVPLIMSVAACVSTAPRAMLASPTPGFSPQAFFSGETIGEGTLKTDFSRVKYVHVIGHGYVEPDGTLVLEQRVEQGGKPTWTRTWHIWPAGDGRFTGTLSDAEGPMSARVRGNLLHIRYKARRGLDTEQWLYLQPGGRVALNRMIVRKFGVPVAALEETITRQD